MARNTVGWTRTTLVCVGLTGALFAWGLTTRPLLIALDWDNAFHLWQINHLLTRGPDNCGLGGTLWTCGYTAHMALEPLYGLGAAVSRSVGGDTLDALRGVNALAVATAAVFLALVVRRAGAPLPMALLIVLAWLGTADVLFLVRTLEDDCVSLAWMAVLLFCSVRASGHWSVGTSLLAGVILATGTLTNYPVIVWAPVILAAAVVYARPDVPLTDRRRLLWGAAFAAGFIATILMWGVWLISYDAEHWSWTEYSQAFVTSPNRDMSGRDGSLGLFLRYIAKYPIDTILPSPWLERAPFAWPVLPLLMLGLVIFGILWPFRHGVRGISAAGRVISLSCLALLVCTIPAAWKGDLTHYERMNHVPLCLAALTGAALSQLLAESRRIVPVLLTVVVVAVLFVNGRGAMQAPRGQSWLARFGTMRTSAPRAMTFVFAESEFQPGDFDKLTSLGIALPNHQVLSPAGEIRRWPFTPVNHILLDEYLAGPPDYRRLSPEAAALIASRPSRKPSDDSSR